MAAKRALKRNAIATAIALSLCSAFNSAAGAQETTLPGFTLEQNAPPVAPQAVQPANLKQSQDLLAAIKGIDDYFFSPTNPGRTDPEYDTASDPFLKKSADNILAALQAGADPNYVDPKTGISAFAWGLWLSYELDRPDVVEEFLKHGADPFQKMPADMPIPQAEQNALNIIYGKGYKNKPGQIAIIDQVVRTIMESQALNMFEEGTLTHSRTAAKIAALIHAASGQTPADALQLPAKAGFKTFRDMAKNIITATALKEAGLLSPNEYDVIANGDPALSDVARHMSAITPEFLEKQHAPLVFHPDNIPGGPEPYTLLQNDTPQSLAHRFQHVMGVKSEAEALQKFVKANKNLIDSKGNFIAGSVGKEVMIPVVREIQVGNIPAPTPQAALLGVAMRMQIMIGAGDLNDAVKAIAAANGMNLADKNFKLGDVVSIGATLKIPTILGGTITTTVTADDALSFIATSLEHNFYKKNVSETQILKELELMNDLDPAKLKLKSCDISSPEEDFTKKCDYLWVPFFNDKYEHLQPLKPPASYDKSRKVHLFIVESEGTHQKQTHSSAVNTGYAINRDVDFSRFHILNDAIWGAYVDYMGREATNILRILQDPENPMRDRIVFSSSMVSALNSVGNGSQNPRDVPVPVAEHQRDARPADNAGFENSRLLLDRLEKASPIVFQAVGNDFPGSGPYTDKYSDLQSARSVRVGAYGTYGGHRMISPYSTAGADICGPLPHSLGNQMEGTSFATPDTAALYRQFSEWYGDVLSFQEIMAAGMLTADRDIPDLFALPLNPPRPTPAQYRTNGAGMPHNDRCGAGALNVQRWNEALKEMVALKKQHNPAGQFHSFKIDLTDPPAIKTLANGDKEYIYRVVVPENMTLDKLTFLLPQEKFAHSEIVVKTPSGFAVQLQKSLNEIVSTTAFNYEDVKAGDVIEIHTGEKLAADAGMYLRGYDDGNAIQLLRNELRAQGLLPAPLKTMVGDRVTGDDPGVHIDLSPALPPLPKQGPGDQPEGAKGEAPQIPPDYPSPDKLTPR